MKNKHRIKQGLALLLAGALTFTNVGAALPAFAEDAPATPETASAATPESAEANVPTPNLSQITENLYDDLPDAPTGSYLGSMGLPVATGETGPLSAIPRCARRSRKAAGSAMAAARAARSVCCGATRKRWSLPTT